MANWRHLKLLKQGVEVWNKWREDHPNMRPNLSNVDNPIHSLHEANLRRANLAGAHFPDTDLTDADLLEANLSGATLIGCYLSDAHLTGADLRNASLLDATLEDATLLGANLWNADLRRANLRNANLRDANLARANLTGADLRGATLENTVFKETVVSTADETLGLDDLTETQLEGLIYVSLQPDVVPANDLPHRIVAFSAPVGPGAMLTSVFLPFSGYHNQVPPIDQVLDAAGLSEPDMIQPGGGEDEFHTFVKQALLRMAHSGELHDPDTTAADALAILEQTMVGVTQSPLKGFSLGEIAKFKGGAAVGYLAWISGEPLVVLGCILGGIFVVTFTPPVGKAAGEAVGNRLKAAIEGFDMIELWRRVNNRIKGRDDDS
jgi:hypothetical protein